MKKYIRWGLIAVLFVLLVGFAGFYVWATTTYVPTEELKDTVDLEEVLYENALVMKPSLENQNGIGIILYPGAKVENTAYAYYANGLKDAGYTVIVPEMLFNFALLSSNKADQYIENFPEIKQWVIGGHSLGGVAAAMYAVKHPVEGLLFLGAYPSKTADLSEKALPVLSIYAEKDGLTLLEDIEAAKSLLPETTVYMEIKGGNHAQFGMYGEQKGDLAADISAIEQQKQMIELTLQWLEVNNLK